MYLEAINKTIEGMSELGHEKPEVSKDLYGNISIKFAHVTAFNVGERYHLGNLCGFGCVVGFANPERSNRVVTRENLADLVLSIYQVNTSERLKAEKLIQSNQPYIQTDNGRVQNPNSPLIEPKKLTRG